MIFRPIFFSNDQFFEVLSAYLNLPSYIFRSYIFRSYISTHIYPLISFAFEDGVRSAAAAIRARAARVEEIAAATRRWAAETALLRAARHLGAVGGDQQRGGGLLGERLAPRPQQRGGPLVQLALGALGGPASSLFAA